jgi:hypothetical protein
MLRPYLKICEGDFLNERPQSVILVMLILVIKNSEEGCKIGKKTYVKEILVFIFFLGLVF